MITTQKKKEKGSPQEPFQQAFCGCFTATLRWPQLDALWERVRAQSAAGWFLYTVGEPPPTGRAAADEVLAFLATIDQRLRTEHREDYCGIVYADDLEAPTFIKIYNPRRLGVVCGISTDPPLPGWIMSLIAPIDLTSRPASDKAGRPWWRRLFH